MCDMWKQLVLTFVEVTNDVVRHVMTPVKTLTISLLHAGLHFREGGVRKDGDMIGLHD